MFFAGIFTAVVVLMTWAVKSQRRDERVTHQFPDLDSYEPLRFARPFQDPKLAGPGVPEYGPSPVHAMLVRGGKYDTNRMPLTNPSNQWTSVAPYDTVRVG